MLSIIIPTYNRSDILHTTLLHLEEAVKNIQCEVIVVNDYKDHSLALDTKIKTVKLIQNPKTGAASARNYGVKKSTGDIILFLDDDMMVSEEVLLKLQELIKSHDKKLFIPNWTYPNLLIEDLERSKFGRFLKKINYTSLEGWINNEEDWQDEKVENKGIASYCLMLTRKYFDEIKGYNENFSFAGFEDHDLSVRLSQSGFKFYILTNLLIYHNEVDRLDLTSWLRRKRRNAQTQREAVEIGYENLKIRNSLSHFSQPRLLMIIAYFLQFICTITPNIKRVDFIYFMAVDALVAINIYLGYNYDYRK